MFHFNSKKSILVNRYPLLVALSIQLVVFASLVWLLRLIMPEFLMAHYATVGLMLHVSLVLALSRWIGLPSWWLWIQVLFPLGLALALSQTAIDLTWFGLFAVVLALIFSNVMSDRVPLYLSNSQTHHALTVFVEEKGVKQVIDLGSGLGGVVRALSRSGVDVLGVEFSPVLALISQAWSRLTRLGRVIRGDMWKQDLSQCDLVYVFLSPVPMSELWKKACREMRSGSWLVSNSFAIVDVEPTEVWQLSDGRETVLYIYQIPEK